MADDPKTPAQAAADKPASEVPGEPLKGEVSRTDAPGAGASAAPVAPPLDAARHLRDAPDALFDYCSDVTATDWPPRAQGRFDVVYCLYSTRHRHRVRMKVIVGEHQPIASVTGLWAAANWLERE